MNAIAIISDLADRKIRMSLEGSDLVFAAAKGALTLDVIAKLRRNKHTLIRHMTGLREVMDQAALEACGDGPIITRTDLEAALSPDDYQDQELMTPEGLTALAAMVQARRIMERGGIPDRWTAQTTCNRCGPVPIFPGCPSEVIGCPWCFVRHKAVPRHTETHDRG